MTSNEYDVFYCLNINETPKFFSRGTVIDENETTYTIRFYNLFAENPWSEKVYDKDKIEIIKL